MPETETNQVSDTEPRIQSPGAPDADKLEEIQESIQTLVESGEEQRALTELQGLRNPDRAEILADLEPENRRALLGSLSNDEIADVLEHMDVDEAIEVTGLVDVARMAAVLETVSADVAADVLRGIDWADAANILVRMEDRSAVGKLLLYDDDDAGGLMSTEFVAMRQTWTTTRALSVLRYSGVDPEDMRQLFAVDNEGVLVVLSELSALGQFGAQTSPSDIRLRSQQVNI
ncbi:MAG: hypothetical protein O3B95_03260 [Chloroflexi bacterium]|nr:hypothetical protein [Chloroflexota bacterium]